MNANNVTTTANTNVTTTDNFFTRGEAVLEKEAKKNCTVKATALAWFLANGLITTVLTYVAANVVSS